ncbi:hypothetical protein EX895_001901 [Sporisorium graminicola]|uniref:Uncharacterized protein n=1 Tax=Sporisorium graminicola TaxID=280036 RepID=A0A4U7KXS5_9BASI|nr:hypothetical protein EX895_001901 [Sporisorium graminicola]TKY89370.1 hypothetical protein EX895_001901 [Sporisorium graminicola]
MLGLLRKARGKNAAEATDVVESDGDEKLSGSSSVGSLQVPDDQAWISAREGYQVMATYLWKSCNGRRLFSENPEMASAVAIRYAKDQYVVCPAQDERVSTFCRSVAILNCEVAITITSPVVTAINSRIAPGTEQIPITSSQHIQVVDTMEQLAGARKAQNACFIRKEGTVVMWCDQVEQLEAQAQDLEDKMIKFVWKSSYSNNTSNLVASSSSKSTLDSAMSEFNMNQAKYRSMTSFGGSTPKGSAPGSDAGSNPFSSNSGEGSPRHSTFLQATGADPEKQEAVKERQLCYQSPMLHGLAIGLDVLLCFLFISKLLSYSLLDGNWMRMTIAAATLGMFPVVMFFCDNILSVVFQILAPIRQVHQNSRYYSGKAPQRMAGALPHITIQMPVYKESLQGVLMPTIESVNKAISTYELQGGTASIIVSEDGMQLLSQQEQAVRHEYYERNNIGWVARPGHGVDDYVRKGRFKKASNLNFTCRLSLAVEKMMAQERPAEKLEEWTEADETELYQRCLSVCLPELHPLAQARGNVRIGDLILLIDSDTRVPEDCLLDAASEMVQSPDVGVLQHCSGVMIVSDSYFEAGIAFFTRMVNFSISYMVAGGDVAPFMGHNAFLRWSAMQEASFVDPEDGVRKVWSESHVSEDFDMALRLLMKGYITRWATYSNNGFEEGVSLTCDDELNRWQKYAFGCSELIFNPLWQWPYRGPLTKLFRTFLWSRTPIHYKFAACSYIFSYYGIAVSLPLTVILFFVQGWFAPILEPNFLAPFSVWVSVMIVFFAGGNVASILAKYRAKVDTLWHLTRDHLKWFGFLFLFFGGLSYHVMTALLSHPLGINMSWGATKKDLEDSNFFLEAPLIFKRFWKVLIIGVVSIGAVIVFQMPHLLPLQWQIQGFSIFFPLVLVSSLHLMYPIALNPALLRFSF